MRRDSPLVDASVPQVAQQVQTQITLPRPCQYQTWKLGQYRTWRSRRVGGLHLSDAERAVAEAACGEGERAEVRASRKRFALIAAYRRSVPGTA
eukprot:2195438-Rhodomonas_salina.13